MKVVILMENSTCRDTVACAHGLSMYIETDKHKILFDMGPDAAVYRQCQGAQRRFDAGRHRLFVPRAQRPLRRPADLPAGNRTAKVYLQKEAFGDYYVVTPTKCAFIGLDPKLHEYADRFVMAEGVTKLDEELTLFSGIRTHELLSEANATLSEKVGGDYPATPSATSRTCW